VLALYGERIQPPMRELPDEQTQALRGLWVRRRNKFSAAREVLERKPRQRKWSRSPKILSQLNAALMM
jgi:hypothetical protein